VSYAINPNSEASRLVNGRELTANDFVTTVQYYQASPQSSYAMNDMAKATVSAKDNWTVVCKLPTELWASGFNVMGDWCTIIPPEVVKKYGNMNDWHNSAGTGPFILTDYVANSSATFVKNPNYWMKDPVGTGKGNQLPYLDGVKYVVIPDLSTQLSALRTAKIDILDTVQWEDTNSLNKTNPELLYSTRTEPAGRHAMMRLDKADLPFKDINVRKALMYATDFNAIKSDFCGGTAQIVTWPYPYAKGYQNAYLSFEESPPEVQELYKYNPDKAKALLAQAGYADGFNAKMVVSNDAVSVDYASILKDQWAKVGVKVTLDQKEQGVYFNMCVSREYDEMLLGGASPWGNCYNAYAYALKRPLGNMSHVDDPEANAAMDKMMVLNITNIDEADRTHKEIMKYVYSQVWAIPAVISPTSSFWWPWVKNFHGEKSIGFDRAYQYTNFIWIDSQLKASMGK